MDGAIQLRYETDLTVEDYITRKAWWDASAPDCPYHPQGGCRLVSHGTYGRKQPKGVRVRRFLCRRSGRTVSLLPDCLASYLPGTLAQVQAVERAVAQARSREAAANQLRPSGCSLVSAVRWVRRRVQRVRLCLQLLTTLLPDRFGGVEPTTTAFAAVLGRDEVLVRLRAVAAEHLHSLPTPVGFRRQEFDRPVRKGGWQHRTGLDPPPAGA